MFATAAVFHVESWKPINFGVKKSKVKATSHFLLHNTMPGQYMLSSSICLSVRSMPVLYQNGYK